MNYDFRNTLYANFGTALVDGDYETGVLDYKAGLGYKYNIIPELSVNADFQIFKLNSTPEINHWWASESLIVEYNMLPYDKVSPLFFVGPGVLHFVDDSGFLYLQKWDTFFNMKFGAGLQYRVSKRISFELSGEWNVTFTDKIDNTPRGRRDDYYYTFGLGLNYHFNSTKSNIRTNE